MANPMNCVQKKGDTSIVGVIYTGVWHSVRTNNGLKNVNRGQ